LFFRVWITNPEDTSADGGPDASEDTIPSKHPELPNTAEVCIPDDSRIEKRS